MAEQAVRDILSGKRKRFGPAVLRAAEMILSPDGNKTVVINNAAPVTASTTDLEALAEGPAAPLN
jgi:hypothetical protein